jgi:hypothetical protein
MQPQDLIAPLASPGVPAPFWLAEALKVLGFTLHTVPMNLWYAGLLVAVWLHLRGSEPGRRFGARLAGQMPVLVAFGINFGIVPLLFLQVTYARAFYPATVLMAWFWMGVIFLLIPAYYGVYAYAFALRQESPMRAWQRAVGWIAAAMFIGIGFLFVNALSLTTRVEAWSDLWLSHNVAGAATGTALNVGDPTFWPRWLLMFGLALGTTAAWAVVDSAWLAGGESEEYRRWVPGFARRLYLASAVWAIAAGACYVFLGWRTDIRQSMFGWPLAPLTFLTAASPVLPAAWVLLRGGEPFSRRAAALVGLVQFGVLAINAVSRQVVQNLELKPYVDVAAQPTSVQWSAVVVFLLLFVAGLGVVAWMVLQLRHAGDVEEYPV